MAMMGLQEGFMRNKYPGRCYRCGLWVEKGQGHFEKVTGGGFRVQHALCAITYRDKKKNDELLKI